MKRFFLATTALVVLALAAFRLAEVLPIGATLPKADVKMKDISGKEIALSGITGKNGLLVMFSCNTCPYVIKNEERTVAICTYARQQNLGVVLINSNEAYRDGDDSYEAMKKYAAEKKYNWPYILDKNSIIADAFGANRTPECFLFDKNQKLVYHGAIDDNPSDASAVTRQHLQEAIKELVEGKDIAVKESRSVGCTIKRIKG